MQETFFKAKDYIHFDLNMQVSELQKLCKIKVSVTANKAALVDLLLNSLAPETADNIDAIGGANLNKAQNSLQPVIAGSAAGTFLIARCGKCQPLSEAVHTSASMARESSTCEGARILVLLC